MDHRVVVTIDSSRGDGTDHPNAGRLLRGIKQ